MQDLGVTHDPAGAPCLGRIEELLGGVLVPSGGRDDLTVRFAPSTEHAVKGCNALDQGANVQGVWLHKDAVCLTRGGRVASPSIWGRRAAVAPQNGSSGEGVAPTPFRSHPKKRTGGLGARRYAAPSGGHAPSRGVGGGLGQGPVRAIRRSSRLNSRRSSSDESPSFFAAPSNEYRRFPTRTRGSSPSSSPFAPSLGWSSTPT